MIPGPTTCLPQDSGEVEGEGTGRGPAEREERVVRPRLSIKNVWTSSRCSNPISNNSGLFETDHIELFLTSHLFVLIKSDLSGLFDPNKSGFFDPDHSRFFYPDHSGLFDPNHLDFSNFTIPECSNFTFRTFSVLKCNHCF